VPDTRQGSLPKGTSPDYLLLTGATGLLGRYLLRDLLAAGRRVAVLVRDTCDEPAAERVETIMEQWEAEVGRPLPRPIVLAGDVTCQNLGLDRDDLHWVAGHVRSVIHAAALVRFDLDERDGEPIRTNLGGTREVLRFCELLGIQDFHYVSTAFVCGRREGTIRENETDCGQDFHNSYEQSKFEAELSVNAATAIRHRTIYRPTIITGDSNTGYTNTYFGMMWYLKLLAVLVPQQPIGPDGKRHTPIEMPVSGDEPHNLVPVNWVSQVITHLFSLPEARGQVFHLASPHRVTMRGVVEVCYDYFGSSGVKFVGDAGHGLSLENDFSRTFFVSSRNYRAYDRFTPDFERANLNRLAGHLSCPPIDGRVVVKFLEFGKSDRWGKRRRRSRPKTGAATEALRLMLDQKCQTGLKRLINGYAAGAQEVDAEPGGGQWRLVPDQSNGTWSLTRGLGPADQPVRSLTVAELHEHAGSPG
jgi:thioester reductase-like protein